MLRAKTLRSLRWLEHGFTTRAAGDLRQPVRQRRLRQALRSASAARWRWAELEQVHGAVIWRIPADADGQGRCVGDGLVTAAPGWLLTIRTADCVPVLIADPEHQVVAAVHAGWRGTVRRVVEKAVGEMRRQFGVRPQALRAAIGPSIRACCYQVGNDVVEAFRAQFAYAEELWHPAEPDPVASRYPMLFMTGAPPGHPYDPRWNADRPVRLDLAAASRHQLLAAGVPAGQIEVLPHCTACHPRQFYSFRREGEAAGRMAAFIGIRASRH
ncbi:MAG: peptidoglycan editing factor PgeF [Terriglobales bacterium]